GTPAMIFVNEEIHRWCFSEMPPIVNADSSDAVHAGLCRLLDESYRRNISAAGRVWYDTYHSNKVITESFSRAIRDVLVPTEERRLQMAVRELRELAAISRHRHEGQAASLTAKEPAVHNTEAAPDDTETALNDIRVKLDAITRQLSVTANTVDQIGPIIPNLLRAQRL